MRKQIPQRVRALLQKEIKSECPFCSITDIDCFEVHHIDGTNSNNTYSNLIMVCPTCHTKIEKGGISLNTVLLKKQQLATSTGKIEFVSMVVSNQYTNWTVHPTNEFAFYLGKGTKSIHPVFNFTFINHSSHIVVLKTIEIKAKDIYSGLSGFGPKPIILKPVVKYHLQLQYGNETNFFHLPNPISTPAGQAFLFQTEVSMGNSKTQASPITDRYELSFTFYFSDNLKIQIPPTYLNCTSPDEGMKISILS